MLFMDRQTGQLFESSQEEIKKAEEKINKEVHSSDPPMTFEEFERAMKIKKVFVLD